MPIIKKQTNYLLTNQTSSTMIIQNTNKAWLDMCDLRTHTIFISHGFPENIFPNTITNRDQNLEDIVLTHLA